MNNEFFLTEVAEDWSQNLAALQDVIRAANQATLARSNPASDPLLDTPNLPNYRGVLRWHMLQKLMDDAAKMNRFQGITSHWIMLGGVSILELRGKRTVLTACHLNHPDEHPRDCTYRTDRRIQNQVCPALLGLGQPEDPAELLHILLVHGGRDSEFAFLRAYIDPTDSNKFRELSKNIMQAPRLVTSLDFEPISEPMVELKGKDLREAKGA